MSRVQFDLIVDQSFGLDDSQVQVIGLFESSPQRDGLIGWGSSEDLDLRSIPEDLLFSRAGDTIQLHNLSGLKWKSSGAAAQERAAIFKSHPDYFPVGIVVVHHDMRAKRILLFPCG